ncbi:cob(I)yrinic acid a,c-diamide adenosyltransferase [Methylocaldum szegediense]|jgi:cob(I)alamin adenosyltransferase|uniref:Corrinoid adenosyltransferase n=1 Tax=Methylocaldum szegediense TaxID=73780 RepID=A0ABN8XCK6_9GAMM|nr:cob(I)yrinic acid a,c-diamide adenosyltransferase [Methylocaldum szegediense]CAI8973147.1 Cobalamin adenosyltransferase [Methylocaldum szegediense]
MGHRLTRIYTRTGDEGTTALGDGTRVDKNAPRVAAYGALDELNSHIGLVLAHVPSSPLRDCLTEIQHILFDLGGDLCILGRRSIDQRHIDWLEQWLDHFNTQLPWLDDFILPGGNPAAAHCHVARTVCRRAERVLVSLGKTEPVDHLALAYLNRLSDFLFVAARILARQDGGQEITWQPKRPPPSLPPH